MANEELKYRYHAAVHALQSAIRLKMSRDGIPDDKDLVPSSGETSPKHLRVGVSSALIETGALWTLLIKKGIVTEDEMLEALVEGFEAEIQDYKDKMGLDERFKFA